MQRQLLTVICSVSLLMAAPAMAQQKSAKQCDEEWTTNKAAIQAGGKTKKAFVAECRTQPVSASTTAPTPAPAPAKTAAPPKQAPAPAPTAQRPQAPPAAAPPPSPPPAAQTQTRPAPTSTIGTAVATGQFANEAQAKSRCPTDTVVWVNLESKIYHFSGNKGYGTTNRGAYMCEKDTGAAGFRAAKNEKHP